MNVNKKEGAYMVKKLIGTGVIFYAYTNTRTGKTRYYKENLSEEEMKELHFKRYQKDLQCD